MKIAISPLNLSEECKDIALLLASMYSKHLNCKNIHHIISADGLQIQFDDYLNLESETGVHRVCRLSPFDSKNRRHTSFVSVSVNEKIVCWPKEKPVRSYVMYPYKLAKDLRTSKQTENLEDLLNGNLSLIR